MPRRTQRRGADLGAALTWEEASICRQVPVSSIRPNPVQTRTHFDDEALASLAASIREVGVLEPILVRETGSDHYELISGERRRRAALRAGLPTVPVLVQSAAAAASDIHGLERSLMENLHREELNPLDEATAYQHLVDEFGYTPEQVASRLGRSREAVTNTLQLLQLPASVQRALADGTIRAEHARLMLGTADRALQVKLTRRIVVEGLDVRAVEEIVGQRAQSLPGVEGEAVDVVPVKAGTPAGRVPSAADVNAPERTVATMQMLNVRETADRLGVHENTVRNWANRGVIRAYRLPGSNFRRFDGSDVQALARGVVLDHDLSVHDPEPFDFKE